MKKLLSIILAILISLSFAACGFVNNSSSDNETTTEDEPSFEEEIEALAQESLSELPAYSSRYRSIVNELSYLISDDSIELVLAEIIAANTILEDDEDFCAYMYEIFSNNETCDMFEELDNIVMDRLAIYSGTNGSSFATFGIDSSQAYLHLLNWKLHYLQFRDEESDDKDYSFWREEFIKVFNEYGELFYDSELI